MKRKPPFTPFRGGPTFHDLRPGDRVVVPVSGRTGTIEKFAGRHNGWWVVWDEPMFGVERGQVHTAMLEPLTSADESANLRP